MQDILEIANRINEYGGRLYLVGGAVRDELMGKEKHDEDYCVTGLSLDKFKEIFPASFIRGKSFAVFDLDGREIALARKERKTGIGHKEFEIETNENISIEEDLLRRDITVNAIAKDVLTGKIIDPYGGKKDIENKTIRAVSEHFKEDPLRVYRIARFACTLQFEIEKNTLEMMRTLKSELDTISAERVFAELSKALLSKNPSVFFKCLRESDCLDVHFKEIYDLIGALQPIEYHPEGDAYNHTMIVLDNAANLTENLNSERKLEIRFAALVHYLGKGATPKEEYPHHYNHEILGLDRINSLAKKIKLPSNLLKCGKTAAREHMRGGIFYEMRPSKQVEFLEKVEKSLLGLDGMQIIVKADQPNSKEFESLGRRCLEEVNGKKLKEKCDIKDGIKFGEKLHQERVDWIKKNL